MTYCCHVFRSNPNVLEYHTYYTLNRDYTARDENTIYGRLKYHLRSKLGNRNFMARLPGKTPRQDFRTLSLQSTGKRDCDSLRNLSVSHVTHWNDITSNRTTENCIFDSNISYHVQLSIFTWLMVCACCLFWIRLFTSYGITTNRDY